MTYQASALARSPDGRYARVLAGPKEVPTLRAAREWAERNREMWRDALDDAEPGFGIVVANGEIALLIAHDRTWGSVGVETKSRMTP